MTDPKDKRLEIATGRMLQTGVTVAALVVLVGGVLLLIQSRGPTPDYHSFHGAPAAYETVGAILAGVVHFNSRNLIEFGLLLLIATPVCRVVFCVVGFSLLKDRLYAAVSAIVLIILLLSFCTRR